MYRLVRVLEILSVNKQIKVTFLAELLNISQVTLRRDLAILEKRGIICRRHGYVSLDGADNTGKRLAFNYMIKKRIAKAAVQTIEEGETVMIESGSCCALLAEELAIAQKKATIITNSIFIKNYTFGLPGISLIFLAGFFQPESQVLVGPLTVKSAENIFTDKFFLGTDGFIPGQAFTCRDHLRAETVVGLSKRAKKVFLLTESDKFNCRGAYNLLGFDSITGIFTDDKIPKEAEDSLLKNNVKVNKVPHAEEKIRWQKFPGLPPVLYKEREGENDLC